MIDFEKEVFLGKVADKEKVRLFPSKRIVG